MRGGLVLGLEDCGSRMTRIGKSELIYGEIASVDELLARVDSVTREDVMLVAEQLLAPTAMPGRGRPVRSVGLRGRGLIVRSVRRD